MISASLSAVFTPHTSPVTLPNFRPHLGCLDTSKKTLENATSWQSVMTGCLFSVRWQGSVEAVDLILSHHSGTTQEPWDCNWQVSSSMLIWWWKNYQQLPNKGNQTCNLGFFTNKARFPQFRPRSFCVKNKNKITICEKKHLQNFWSVSETNAVGIDMLIFYLAFRNLMDSRKEEQSLYGKVHQPQWLCWRLLQHIDWRMLPTGGQCLEVL